MPRKGIISKEILHAVLSKEKENLIKNDLSFAPKKDGVWERMQKELLNKHEIKSTIDNLFLIVTANRYDSHDVIFGNSEKFIKKFIINNLKILKLFINNFFRH